MTAELQQFITSAAGVFVGSTPLIGVIGWAAFIQNQRLARIENQLDELGKDLKAIGVRTGGLETRVTAIESDLNRPRVAPAPR